jgi:hypothetical protein
MNPDKLQPSNSTHRLECIPYALSILQHLRLDDTRWRLTLTRDGSDPQIRCAWLSVPPTPHAETNIGGEFRFCIIAYKALRPGSDSEHISE